MSKTLDTSEPRPKQNRRPEPRKHTKDPRFGYFGVVNFFRHYESFSEKILIAPKGRLQVFDFSEQNGCYKTPRVPFYNLRHCEIFQNDDFLYQNLVFSLTQHAISEFGFLRPSFFWH